MMPQDKPYFAHTSACIDEPCQIGEGTKIWHFCHVAAGARIGKGCILGQNVYVAGGVTLGDGVRVQNNVSLYEGTLVEDDVFIGPSAVLTNVVNPRASIDRRAFYEITRLRRGATIGANATIVCGVTVGRHAFIGAGAVITRDVPDYALMIGVPARRKGWMSRHGHKLVPAGGDHLRCPESGLRYERRGDAVHCLDLDEDAPLLAPSGERPRGALAYRDASPSEGAGAQAACPTERWTSGMSAKSG